MLYSYDGLYQIDYKKHIMLLFFIVIIIISFIISFKIKAYSSYKTYGVYLDNYLYVDIPLDNSDVLQGDSYIKINDNKYNFKIEEISDLQVEGIINYQTYSFKSPKDYKNNQVVEITFYYNKQRIIDKIIHIIF